MKRFVVGVVAAVTLAVPAIAQDASARVGQSGDKLVLEAHDHRFATALPAWFAQSDGMTLNEQEVIISGDENSTRFEIVPKGQNADDWTQIFGVRIVLEPERKLSEYRQAAAFGYAISCRGETGHMFLASKDTDEDVIAPLVFMCGEFVPGAQRPGQGEIMSMAFRRTDAGIAVVYEEFRTPAYNAKDTATWPVSGEAMVERAQQLMNEAALEKLDG